MLIVKHTLATAEQMKNEGDFVSGMLTQSRPLDMRRYKMKILKDMWYGNIDSHSVVFKMALEWSIDCPYCKNDDTMRTMLSDIQKEQYEKLHNCQDELTDLLERKAFSKGFCLTVKIMVDVMNAMEIP